ncbi:MAG TPA: DUF72 domain-containing protein [Candidatus Binataceae bacterium]|jgi:uncharacterized protein YecE (DUF72 family)|nr:DUF72 domain-containing protein [Candidatus Binataceae bacterium]
MPSRPQFLVGTASWTDPTLVKSDTFYPPALKTAEERLRFYAAQFNTVEVDATYYALVSERNAELWAERTPPGFVFNVKAFAMLTQHPVDTARLPSALKAVLPADERAAARLRHPPREALEMAFGMFWSALGPLRATGKLGHLLFQFPPYFTARSANFDYLAGLKERMPGAAIAIEFRHNGWYEGAQRAETVRFLERHGLTFVSIDTPPATVESGFAVTGAQAYVRFHGRNRENWYKRDGGAAERFKYLYAEAELAPWAERLKSLSDVRRASVIFNNCYSNFGVMNAATMAQMLRH